MYDSMEQCLVSGKRGREGNTDIVGENGGMRQDTGSRKSGYGGIRENAPSGDGVSDGRHGDYAWRRLSEAFRLRWRYRRWRHRKDCVSGGLEPGTEEMEEKE